jgi:hypothetical protein
MKASFYLLIICLLTACSTVRYMEISAYNPSETTYPENVRKVLIVNNALPQPPDTGCEFKILGVLQDTCRMYADSALFDACRALGAAIAEADFFDDVLLFHEATRRDEVFYADVKLSPEAVNSLCEETGADAVISFDRLLFDMKNEITVLAEGYVSGSVRVDVRGVVRSYLPGRVNPTVTALVSDSIFWLNDAYNMEELDALFPAPGEALQIAANIIGIKLHPVFVPHWENEIRWYFTGIGARWKEAAAYATAGKWENASERWQYIYNTSSRWSDKAKSASNLALACEIGGQLEKALEWAEISRNLFEKNRGKDYARTRTQQLYSETLKQRILDDGKLNLQIGTE